MNRVPVDIEGLSADERRRMLAGLMQHRETVGALRSAATETAPGLIIGDRESRFEPFPLTDTQHAYWLGQQGLFALGDVSTHAYLEFEAHDIDITRATAALNRLIGYHDMLRAVIGGDGQQRVLRRVEPYTIVTRDLRSASAETQQAALQATRDEMSHQVLAPDRWPLFDIRATRFGHDRVRLHISLSLLVLDAWSIRLLLEQWFSLYDDPDRPLPALEVSFRDFVLMEAAARDGAAFRRAEAYWRARLDTLPPGPDLPLVREPGAIERARFVRRERTLDARWWGRLKAAAGRHGLTTSGLLLSAFGTVLARWSQRPAFSINATVFNREPIHPQIIHLIGDFTSTMLVALEGAPRAAFIENARTWQQRFHTDLDHCRYSGIRVLRDLVRRHGRDVAAYTPVVFTSILGTASSAARLLAAGDFVYGVSQTPQVWLDHQVMEHGDTLAITWDAIDALFPPGLLDDMFEAHGTLLHRLAHDPSAWVERQSPRKLPTGASDETRAPAPSDGGAGGSPHQTAADSHAGAAELPDWQRALLAQVNATAAPISADCLHTLTAKAADAHANRPALLAENDRRTHAEVLRQSRRLAHRLRASGVRRNHPVAVLLDKGCDQLVAALAIVQAGAAYLPVDPGWPLQRVRQVLEIGEIDLIVTSSALAAQRPWLPEATCVVVDAPGDNAEAIGESSLPAVTPSDLAYVIFTSGSTGTPKGVVTDHRGAVNTILDINERFSVGPDDRVLALSALHFDLSVYDLFGLLAAGGAVVLPEPGATRDPRRWVELIQRESVTIWNTVPALMEMLVEHLEGRGTILPSLRLVLLSGDWVPVSLPDRIRRIAPHARIVSLGGATEASIWSICYPIESVDPNWKSIPYGKPLRNQGWRVLNGELEDCPVWVPGDLYISGIGLAVGYWRDEEKTAASFITHPATGQRLYRTGDRGRYLPDGNIEFLGRVDTQVKILGQRIELGEIEHALASHPDVRRAVVAAVGPDRTGKHLVAYVIMRSGLADAEASAADVRRRLREQVAERLPCHMIPSEIMFLDELPLTANGKVDRDRLPLPGRFAPSEPAARPAPADSSIARMAELIAHELSLPAIDPDANLMQLGADSVDMVRIANRIEREFGFQPSLAEFFRNPTIAALAAAQARASDRTGDRAVATPPAASHPPSPANTLILDPAEREAFKARRPGIRAVDPGQAVVPLDPRWPDAQPLGVRAVRRSWRTFDSAPLPVAALAGLLAHLRGLPLRGATKFAYGSAGGLYPVQTYVHVRAGRVAGLNRGIYYYHPLDHTLASIAADAEIPPDVHEPFINRGMFESSAFSVFLIGQLRAIEPLYGEHALRFCTIEAGLMTQLLETEAPTHGIGLCQVGWLAFDRIADHFQLDSGHHLLHSLVGGGLPREADSSEPDAAPPAPVREEGEI